MNAPPASSVGPIRTPDTSNNNASSPGNSPARSGSGLSGTSKETSISRKPFRHPASESLAVRIPRPRRRKLRTAVAAPLLEADGDSIRVGLEDGRDRPEQAVGLTVRHRGEEQ